MKTLETYKNGKISNSRRQFLGGLAVASLPLVAGCTALTEGDFNAGEVYMPAEAADALGYEEIKRETISSVERGEVYSFDVEARLTSHFAVYDKIVEIEEDVEGADVMRVSAVSSPQAVILRNAVNPLSTLGRRALLTNPRGQWYLNRAGFEEVELGWTDGPTFVSNNRAAFLGGQERLYSVYAGTLGEGEDARVVFAHAIRVDSGDDVVLGLAVRHWPASDMDRPYVGEDGYLTDAELAADFVAVVSAFEAIRHDT